MAIIGSGPAAFYAAEHLFKQTALVVEADMFDRLPTPFGLVRYGVAPDHAKIKTVTRAYDGIAANPRFRFFGNVEFGRHLTLADLQQHYHQVVFATGAQTDRRMGIPGEDLAGSHPATEFVAWYNGHPDYRDYPFDLSVERAAVVGVGNVAIDVARILVRTPEELVKTDIAAHALEAPCAQSRIKEVFLLGRRGPAQAAFTNPEVKEIGEMADADVDRARPTRSQLDPLSQAQLDASQDRTLVKKVEILQGYALRRPEGKGRRLHVRFLVSPVELVGRRAGPRGPACAWCATRWWLPTAARSTRRPPTSSRIWTSAWCFARSATAGCALPGVPFHERWGVILEREGARAGSGHQAAGDRRVRLRLDQARPKRRHRHQQAGFRGDRHLHARGPGATARTGSPRSPPPTRRRPWCRCASRSS